MIGQMELSGVCGEGEGTAAYISTMPFILYAWIAILIVPLFMFKVIPEFEPMRKASKRALETGQTLPDSVATTTKENDEEILEHLKGEPKAMNFIVPILVLAVVTLWTAEMLYGVLASLGVCAIMYGFQRLMSPGEFFDAIWEGFSSMVPMLALIISAWILLQANTELGLANFVIETTTPYLSAGILPLIVFIITAILTFCTGSFWGIPAIVFPVMIPMAMSLDVNLLLTSGAIISAASFGSQACFYGDGVSCTCVSTQIKNIDYAKTAIPLIMVPFVLACIAFLIVGVIMA